MQKDNFFTQRGLTKKRPLDRYIKWLKGERETTNPRQEVLHNDPRVRTFRPGTSVPTRFARESEMLEFFVANLDLIEPGLRLYTDTGEAGVQFSCRISKSGGSGCIDILAVDAQGAFVVIELKNDYGNAPALGQLLGYMAWVRRILAPGGRRVRGILIVKSANPLLKLALAEVPSPDIEIVEFRDYLEVL